MRQSGLMESFPLCSADGASFLKRAQLFSSWTEDPCDPLLFFSVSWQWILIKCKVVLKEKQTTRIKTISSTKGAAVPRGQASMF